MIGNQEASTMMFLIGLFALLFLLFIPFDPPVPMLVKLIMVISIMFFAFAHVFLNWLISYNKLQPFINKINPERDKVWLRVTKGKLFTAQIVKNGAYGQTKGLMNEQKADVIDKGDFPLRLMNGNPAILVYDLMSHNANVDHAVGWKQLFKRQKVSSGKEAYQKYKTDRVGKEVDKLVS